METTNRSSLQDERSTIQSLLETLVALKNNPINSSPDLLMALFLEDASSYEHSPTCFKPQESSLTPTFQSKSLVADEDI